MFHLVSRRMARIIKYAVIPELLIRRCRMESWPHSDPQIYRASVFDRICCLTSRTKFLKILICNTTVSFFINSNILYNATWTFKMQQKTP